MSGPNDVLEQVIQNKQEIIDFHAKGNKPESAWKIGTEHEKFGFRLDDLRAPAYEGDRGIEAMLRGLTRFGWTPYEENGKVIAMSGADGTVSLEPAGQLELSGAPLENLHQTCAETGRHLAQVKAIGEKTGKGFLGCGR